MTTTEKLSHPSFIVAAGPLLLVLFIDGMGLGLVFPILNAMIMDPASHLIATHLSMNARNLIFVATIGVFMLCWFFGAAYLGDLSDQIGRKKSLLICLGGSFLGYFLSALSIWANSFSLLVLGRMIAGFTAGSQPIAQAAIVDISTAEHKARNIGWILFAISMGFVFGPLLGGVLSDPALFSGFSYATPFVFASFISLLNALLLQLFFHETFYPKVKKKLKLHGAIEVLISAFRHEKVRELSYIFLVMVFGWSSFYTFISMFLFKAYQFSTLHISLFMGVLGIGFGIGNGFLVDLYTSHFRLKSIVITNLLLAAFFVLIIVGTNIPLYAWLAVLPVGAFGAAAYAVILTIFSNQVDADSQGWVMGITGAIMAFAFGINSVFVALLAGIGVRIPLILAVLGLALSAVMMFLMYREKSPT